MKVLREGEASKTKLANKANLDTRASKTYLDLLILGLNFITRDSNTNHLTLTDKGREYLERYLKLKKLLVSGFAVILSSCLDSIDLIMQL